MPDARVLGASKTVKLDDAAFGARFHGSLVHESVRAEQAARRRGTAATKTRGMVSGGGAKPWRQKGTGRARAGSSRSPVWTGGGTAFGPRPRSYTFKVNRKERRAALRSALSLHGQRGSVAIVDAGGFAEPRTRVADDLLDAWGQPRPTLVVLVAEESNAALSFRNLPGVAVLTPESVGVADLLGAASLAVSQGALDALTARAAGTKIESEPAARAASPAPARPAKAAEPEPEPEPEPEEPEAAAPAPEPKAAAEPDAAAEPEFEAAAPAPEAAAEPESAPEAAAEPAAEPAAEEPTAGKES